MITKRDIESLGYTFIKQIGYSQAFIADKNDTICYLSYTTIIGIYDAANNKDIFTDHYYSTTTSRHRNKFIKEYNGIIDNDRFNILLAKYGLN